MQVCTKCGREVPSSNFYAKPDSIKGQHSWCKDCLKRRSAGFLSSKAAAASPGGAHRATVVDRQHDLA